MTVFWVVSGRGGGGGGGREKKGGWGGVDPILKKEEGFQFQTSQGMNGKTGVPGGKTPISRMQ